MAKMITFGGIPQVYAKLDKEAVAKWFTEKVSKKYKDANFEKEWAKIQPKKLKEEKQKTKSKK